MSNTEEQKKRNFPQEVDVRERRKLRARNRTGDEVWFGLGMFGMVGWSVAIPTVLSIFIGVWIDVNYTSRYSWTLMLLVVGLIIGCANAWFWINKQRRSINKDREDDDTD
jgi:ATP synthase protein I